MEPKSSAGLIIGIIVGVIALGAGVAVACYCKNKGDDKEGGEKTLFKTSIKKNNQNKQSLVDH